MDCIRTCGFFFYVIRTGALRSEYQKLINAFKTTQHPALHSLKYLLREDYKTQANIPK